MPIVCIVMSGIVRVTRLKLCQASSVHRRVLSGYWTTRNLHRSTKMDCASRSGDMNGNPLEEGAMLYMSEIVKGRFFFGTMSGSTPPVSSKTIHYFSIDEELLYRKYTEDFGPLNLGMLYRYCRKLNGMLKDPSFQEIVHCTSSDPQKRVNSAFLVGGYLMVYRNMEPDEAFGYVCDSSPSAPRFVQFRDAGFDPDNVSFISLLDVFEGLYRAFKLKFFDFADFDLVEYEYYERIFNGGLTWIVPEKLIGFSSPMDKNGVLVHPPEIYFDYFQENGVECVVRLNRKEYEAVRFTSAGIGHADLHYSDGTTPPDEILRSFLRVVEETQGALAVHCKAGLGRTGTLIACYVMRKYGFSAREAIAWLRICRPGSVIGNQQAWLEQNEPKLRKPMEWPVPDEMIIFKYPIYSILKKAQARLLAAKKVNEKRIPERNGMGAREEGTSNGQGDLINNNNKPEDNVNMAGSLARENGSDNKE